MKRFGFEAAPLVLAFVLGRMAEELIRQALLMSSGRFSIMLTRPIATTLITIALVVLVLPVILPPVKRLLRTVSTGSLFRSARSPEKPRLISHHRIGVEEPCLWARLSSDLGRLR